MEATEWILSPWNEKKIQVLIDYFEKKKISENKLLEDKINRCRASFNDIDNSIQYLEQEIEKNNRNEDIEDFLYKEIYGLYELRRKKIKRLLMLGIIEHISTVDSAGLHYIFNVNSELIKIQKLEGIYFKVSERNNSSWKHFVFKILFDTQNRILIYQVDNQDIPELSAKGIVKAMIEAILSKYKKNVISSTNKEVLKIDNTEGRIPQVTAYWKKWLAVNKKIKYDQAEDRFIYET